MRAVPSTKAFEAFVGEIAARQPLHLLAVHCVIEGSNNGARFIAKAVRKAYGLRGIDGTFHLDPHGDAQKEKWKAFGEAFNACDIPDADMEQMIAVGRRTFELMNAIGAEAHALPENRSIPKGSDGELRDAIARKLAANPAAMTPVLAETLGVSELDPARIEDLVRSFERLGTVPVVVRNAGCTCELRGAFGGFSRSDPYLNIISESLHLHIRTDRAASAFAVQRPGPAPGTKTLSFQVFDASGASVIKAFCMQREGDAPRDFAAPFAEIAREFERPAGETG